MNRLKRLPRLSRGQKTLRNLILCALPLLYFWGLAGYPLPTMELEFRRMERTRLLPRSEIVFQNSGRSGEGHLSLYHEERSVFALDGTELHLRGRWFAGVREGQGVLAWMRTPYRDGIRSFSLEDGPTLIPLVADDGYFDSAGYWIDQGPKESGYYYIYHHFTPFLLLDAPTEAVRAELAVETKSGGGWPLENGLWMLGIENGGEERMWGMAYTLRLYDEGGSLLLEKSGTLGEG